MHEGPGRTVTVDWVAADLAPGDGKSLGLDRRALAMRAIFSAAEPAFEEVYRALWDEFGPGGGMETVEVIAARLAWSPRVRPDGWTLFYQLLTVSDAEGLAAVRDHSVIVPPDGVGGRPPFMAVHLSHLLVAPRWRRTGLAGWMRAVPLQAVQVGLRGRSHEGRSVPVTLVTEMNPPPPGRPQSAGRMLAYGQAGFRVVDPGSIHYFQPDFRPAEDIAAGGGAKPLPMLLLVRRVGREAESVMDGAELRSLVEALYYMYATGCREEDIDALRVHVRSSYPMPGESVRLLRPSEFAGG